MVAALAAAAAARAVGGGSTGSGGSATGSGGAGSGSGGAGGSTQTGEVMPSAGCGKSGRPSGGKVSMSNVQIIDFPTSYDGMKPFPLLVALHACGNPNTQWEGITNDNGFGTEYVRYMPNTTDTGQCWNNYNNNIARILQQYDDIMANYCIDKNHVYGVGHSSGAQMLVNILSHKTDAQHLNLRAVSPVAADPYNVAIPMPVLYIDGMMDNQRSATSATNAVAKFRAANMCSDTSKTYTEIMGCKSRTARKWIPGARSTTTAPCRRSGARTTIPATAGPSTASRASRSPRCTTSSRASGSRAAKRRAGCSARPRRARNLRPTCRVR